MKKKQQNILTRFRAMLHSLLAKHGTAIKLARYTGIPRSTISSYKRGAAPTLEAALLIARYFKIPIGQLVGEVATLEENSVQLPELVPNEDAEARTPWSKGKVRCTIDLELFATLRTKSKTDLVMWRVEGDAMKPILCNGEWIIIDAKQKKPRSYAAIFAVKRRGEIMCREIIAPKEGALVTVREIYSRKTEILSDADFEKEISIVGTVLATVKWLDEIHPIATHL